MKREGGEGREERKGPTMISTLADENNRRPSTHDTGPPSLSYLRFTAGCSHAPSFTEHCDSDGITFVLGPLATFEVVLAVQRSFSELIRTLSNFTEQWRV